MSVLEGSTCLSTCIPNYQSVCLSTCLPGYLAALISKRPGRPLADACPMFWRSGCEGNSEGRGGIFLVGYLEKKKSFLQIAQHTFNSLLDDLSPTEILLKFQSAHHSSRRKWPTFDSYPTLITISQMDGIKYH